MILVMKKENLLKKYLEAIKNKQPLTINYGKGMLSNEDIKDYATWDYKLGKYTDETGQWDTELLIDIAKGKVEGTTLEI